MRRTAVVIALTGCAPISTNTRVHDTELRRANERIGEPAHETLAEAKPGDDGLAIAVVDRAMCTERPVRYVKRTETIERSVNKLVLSGELVLGLGAAGFGGYSLYDANQASTNGTDPTLPTSTTTVGALALAASAPFLIAGIIDIFRSGDEVHVRDDVAVPDPQHDAKVACGDTPKTGVVVALALPDGSSVPLGTSDAGGRIVVPWATLGASAVGGAAWPHTATLFDDHKAKLADVDVVPVRAALAEAMWKATVQSTDAAAYAAYASQFPEAHSTDLAAGRADVIAKQYAAAIAANDPVAAKAALAAWRAAAPDDPGHAQRDAEVAALTAKVEQAHALETATKGIEALEAGNVARPVPEIEAALARVASDPASASQADPLRVRLTAARAKLAPTLITRADTELRAGNYAAAVAAFQQAQDIGPAELGLAKRRPGFDKRIEAAIAGAVATAVRTGALDRAHELTDLGDKLLPGSAAIAAARHQIERGESAAQKAAADKAAREQAAADKAEADKAAADKAAADKAAREQAAADKAAADKAAREQAAADKAAAAQAARDKATADKAARDQAAADKAAADKAAREQAASEKAAAVQAARDKVAADKAAADQAAVAKAAADKAAREQAASEKAAAVQAARDKSAADKAATDQAAAAKVAALQAARDRLAADQAAAAKVSADKAAHDKVGAQQPPPTTNPTGQAAIEVQQPGAGSTEVKSGAFNSGYTDEEQCRPTGEVLVDPYGQRAELGAAAGIGFGAGYANQGMNKGMAGLLVGEAGVRYRMARAFGSLSGGTGLQTLDIAAGADGGLGYEVFHGLAIRGGYAHGWPIRSGSDWNELRADVGLSSLAGISWVGLRVRLDDSFGFNAFYVLVMLDRLR
jgi:hypothetical protein